MRTSSLKSGKSTLKAAEVVNVSGFGFWISVDNREFFLSYRQFPWFKDATIAQLCNISRAGDHFFWPDLDVDLDLERIEYPERFPLVSK